MSIFGDIIDAGLVEEAVIDTLQLWQETYLAEIERNKDKPPRDMPLMRHWLRRSRFSVLPDDQTPLTIVMVPGLAQPPVRRADGSYEATFAVGVGVMASANTPERSRALVKEYCSAWRTLLVQHPTLGGLAVATDWLDESYDVDVDEEVERALAAGTLMFAVTVRDVMFAKTGPSVVPDDPYAVPGALPTVVETIETIAIVEEIP